MKFVDLKKQYEIYKNNIDEEIKDTISNTAFIMGPKVQKIEDALKNYVKVNNAIAVSSGTDALLFALMAYDIGTDDEVITTPFTFISTAEVISFLKAKPVFADIDPITYNIDASKIEALITDKTKAIIPVSLYGQCPDIDKINEIALKHNIPVIEDACQSFGAEYKSKKSCSLTDIGCTSFFPSKPFGCFGDGGMIFCNDNSIASKIKKIRVHGQDKRYHHEILGTNGRLDAIQAAILLGKWPFFDEELIKRVNVGNYYYKQLSNIPGIITPVTLSHNKHVYAQFSIQVENRENFIKILKENNIPNAIHYPIPLHLQPAFKYLGYKEGDFKISEEIANKIVSLPMHPFLTKEEQDEVVDVCKKAIG